MKIIPLFILVLCLGAIPLQARLFTDDQGRTVEADLLGVNGPNVVLEKGGQSVQWPIKQLSVQDQAYVKAWLKRPAKVQKVRLSIWEREGIGESGVFEAKSVSPQLPKNIPMLRSTEEKAKYRYYDVDLSNFSTVDALDLHLSYAVYVIDASNKIVDYTGAEKIEKIEPGERVSRVTKAATFVRSKTTSATFGIGVLGNLTTGTSTERSKERFGGAWVRVYGPNGELLGETKQLHDDLKRLDFRFTGSTGSEFVNVPVLETFQKLEEFFKKLPKPPGGFPPKPPFLK